MPSAVSLFCLSVLYSIYIGGPVQAHGLQMPKAAAGDTKSLQYFTTAMFTGAMQVQDFMSSISRSLFVIVPHPWMLPLLLSE